MFPLFKKSLMKITNLSLKFRLQHISPLTQSNNSHKIVMKLTVRRETSLKFYLLFFLLLSQCFPCWGYFSFSEFLIFLFLFTLKMVIQYARYVITTNLFIATLIFIYLFKRQRSSKFHPNNHKFMKC